MTANRPDTPQPLQKWSEDALHALARDYFAMLQGELRGRQPRDGAGPYTYSHQLTHFAPETIIRGYRHVSWLLMELGLPCLTGHGPLSGYPGALIPAIERYLRNHPELLALMQVEVDRPVHGIPEPGDRPFSSILTDPPTADEIPGLHPGRTGRPPVSGVDYLEREQQNYSLRMAGEQFVIACETRRLMEAGCDIYADGIEHVSAEEGEACGYAIHSYDLDGSDRFIQVKTTRFRRETPFYVTANEVEFSSTQRKRYWLYRVFDFRERPRLYCMNGPLDEHLSLEPTTYRARTR